MRVQVIKLELSNLEMTAAAAEAGDQKHSGKRRAVEPHPAAEQEPSRTTV